jgi:hypothetical protein
MQKGEERRGNKDGKWGRRRKEKESEGLALLRKTVVSA